MREPLCYIGGILSSRVGLTDKTGEPLTSTLAVSISLSLPKCYHLLMIDWSSCSVIERDPDRVSGAWVFCGTRVPVAALFENLEEDASVHEFLEWFPGVSLSQARAVLEHAARSTSLAA